MALNLGMVTRFIQRKVAPTPAAVQQERATSLSNLAAQAMELIRAELDVLDPDGWHWLQDLYFDPTPGPSPDQGGELFVVTVSSGRLYRWPLLVDGTTVTVGDPMIVEIEFTPRPEGTRQADNALARSVVRQAADGTWYGVSVMCTATVNKMGILDSRALFDSFVARFGSTSSPTGGREEYINILHLGGASSKIGEVRHIFRDDKLLVGFYTFTKDDPIAEAAARTLAADEDGEWGGSIEFLHYGDLETVTVAEGIELPVTKDGKFLGYSFARSADCAAWHTGNLVQERMAMTEKDKKIARQLLGSDALVAELAKRLGETNRTLAGAVTYTVVRGTSGELRVANAESSGQAGSGPLPNPPQGEGIDQGVGVTDDRLVTYELDEEAIGLLSSQVIERANLAAYDQRWADVQRQVEEIGNKLVEVTELSNGQVEAFELRQAQLTARMAVLEQDEQVRYQEYDAAKPKQPVIKVGVRPRAAAPSTSSGAVAVDVRQESAFAVRARERRSKA